MSSLFVIKGRDQGKRFELDSDVLAVGRDADNHIQLHDTEVSRHHAELRLESDQCAIVDLKSSNGTFVNSQKIENRALRNGDRLQLGRTLMIFTGPDHSASENLDDMIKIVGHPQADDDSRIVHSISHEDSESLFGELQQSQSPWLSRARSNLQIMYRTALAVSHTLDIDQLLGRILELIFEWVESDRGCIMLLNQETDLLEPKVHLNRTHTDDQPMNISRRILDYVMDKKEGVLSSNASQDQRWDPGGSIVQAAVREAICVPMQGRYGIVGVIYIDTYTPPGQVVQQSGLPKFTDEHLKLMVAIAHQAALAVEDTSYYSAMVQAERLAAIGQTIATLSHHIKNILQGIRGGSYLIEEGLKSDEPDVVRKGWGIVEKNQDKISNLVMDMLTFSKEREPDLMPANLNRITADVIELVQIRARQAGVELDFRPDERMPDLTFDPDGLHRAILNVVSNAIDACHGRPQSRIDVATDYLAKEEIAQVVVNDNGIGIAPDDLDAVFKVFESRKGGKGTGLGLSVSRKILREHGGDVHVESELQVGSRFVLQIPALLPEEKLDTIVADD